MRCSLPLNSPRNGVLTRLSKARSGVRACYQLTLLSCWHKSAVVSWTWIAWHASTGRASAMPFSDTVSAIQTRWPLRRRKWLDMGQSLNLYLARPDGNQLSEMYLLAWEKGLKTTYYLRSLAATQIEKSTSDVNRRGLQPRWMRSKSASANIQVKREGE